MQADFTIIPTIDLSLAQSPETKPLLLSELRSTLVRVGFFYVKNHGIPEQVQQDAIEQSAKFFELPLEEELEIETSDPIYLNLQGPSQWPPTLPTFGPAIEAYRSSISTLATLAHTFTPLIEAALCLPPSSLTALFHGSPLLPPENHQLPAPRRRLGPRMSLPFFQHVNLKLRGEELRVEVPEGTRALREEGIVSSDAGSFFSGRRRGGGIRDLLDRALVTEDEELREEKAVVV
ncbi:hypothetical protein B0H67DRAFT_679736 [Lasiosphaeris hirsuta]|uniref:Non-haem dioxygenase N-terminal domain-containing protein n=1 Tax=Lasiosphaeris hirsuta TaxID=260670 RepID=A0AA40BDK3_9PEZI|nr:hypothetical protein B0H67DRAFT_679736 [Lasiosphaeris hirsuta]